MNLFGRKKDAPGAPRRAPQSTRTPAPFSPSLLAAAAHRAALLFAVAPPPAPSTTQDAAANAQGAITKVRDMIETIEKRETHIGRKIDNEITNAKKFSAAGKKREALQCIKRKKMYEKQLDQIRRAGLATAATRTRPHDSHTRALHLLLTPS